MSLGRGDRIGNGPGAVRAGYYRRMVLFAAGFAFAVALYVAHVWGVNRGVLKEQCRRAVLDNAAEDAARVAYETHKHEKLLWEKFAEEHLGLPFAPPQTAETWPANALQRDAAEDAAERAHWATQDAIGEVLRASLGHKERVEVVRSKAEALELHLAQRKAEQTARNNLAFGLLRMRDRTDNE